MLSRRDTITFRLLDAFFRNLGIFLLCVIGVSSIVATALLIRSQSYVASASIRVLGDTNVQTVVNLKEYSPWESPAQIHAARFSDSMQDLLPSGFVNTILQSAKLNKPINTAPEARDPRFAKFRKNVYATASSKELLSIGLTWDDPIECERLVKALQDGFIESTGKMRQVEGIATVAFLDSEIEKNRKRLQEAEQALMDFKSQQGGMLPDAEEADVEQLANLKMDRDFLVVTSQDFVLRRQTLEARLKQIKPESVLSRTVSTDPIVLQIRSLESKRNDLITRDYRLDSDSVKAIDAQIATLQKDLENREKLDPDAKRNTQEIKLQDNPEYRDLMQQLTLVTMDERTHKARITQLNQRIAESEQRMRKLPVAQRALVEKTRDRAVIEKQYQNLLERREQAQLKASVDKLNATTKLIPQALIHAEPTLGASKKIMLVGVSIVLGLIVGCIMVLVREWMDVSLRYATDAERLLGVPVLASLPASPDLQFPLSGPRNGRARGRLLSSTGSLPAISAPPGTE